MSFGSKGLAGQDRAFSQQPGSTTHILRYRIGASVFKQVFAIVMFSVAAAGFALLAMVEEPWRVFTVLYLLGPTGSSIVFIGAALFFLYPVLTTAKALFSRDPQGMFLTIDANAVKGPKNGLSSEPMRIAFSDIASIKGNKHHDHIEIKIISRSGDKLTLSSGQFDTKEDFGRAVHVIRSRAPDGVI
ncbi:hypothetical protein [Aurantiacibacter gangjinensis]|uniref:Uncharacterized protein n=1 Tax=Aurantiacibacter gangjinensis TaxID=502682 RepID=A0A0G9MPT6_9SPHN|nr:hypothetical protein [Aurantiacibacter gangjinensis]APE28535.1 hypothetical protein BMF35_a1706 [Aurantiacibacter gangjinensis]KLE32736.1 hypothetical protein AAW01_01410 [Aurantiacibacter gangjinensis]